VADEHYNYDEGDPNAASSITHKDVEVIDLDTVILRGLPYGKEIVVSHAVVANAQPSQQVAYSRASHYNGTDKDTQLNSLTSFTFSDEKSTHEVTFIDRYSEQASPPPPPPPPGPGTETPPITPPITETETETPPPAETETETPPPTETDTETPPPADPTDEPELPPIEDDAPEPPPETPTRPLPELTNIENTLVPTDDGTFIEMGPDGVPLGEWHWDPENEEWIFDEYPPLGDFPPTGDNTRLAIWATLCGAAGMGALAVTALSRKRRKRQ
jgi:hypothetical protein